MEAIAQLTRHASAEAASRSGQALDASSSILFKAPVRAGQDLT
jgi:hypothetical protein